MAFKITESENLAQARHVVWGISAPSGVGKTYTSILIGLHIASQLGGRLGVIDAEQRGAAAYKDIGKRHGLEGSAGTFIHLDLDDFSPMAYGEAMGYLEKRGCKVIVVDGISPEWMWCLSEADKRGGHPLGWKFVRPLHNAFMPRFRQSSAPVVILTMRADEKYGIEETTNKNGLKGSKVVSLGEKPNVSKDFKFELDVFAKMETIGDDSNTECKLIVGRKSRVDLLGNREFVNPGKEVADIVVSWLGGAGLDDIPRPITVEETNEIRERCKGVPEAMNTVKKFLESLGFDKLSNLNVAHLEDLQAQLDGLGRSMSELSDEI